MRALERILLINGNALHIPLADESVQMIATSPPYWSLRRYEGPQDFQWPTVEYSPMPGLAPIRIQGCEPECDHVWETSTQKRSSGGEREYGSYDGGVGRGPAVKLPPSDTCQLCGGWRGSFGLEPTPEMYIGHLVLIWRELWRVLREDGICFLNLGDSYASQGGPEPAQTKWQVGGASATQNGGNSRIAPSALKPKDLCGIPWRAAFALQADGWWLRSDIIWAKKNCMPESMTDRPTKAHEYIFLLAKSKHYFYDNEAIKEPLKETSVARLGRGIGDDRKDTNGYPGQPPHSIVQPRPNKGGVLFGGNKADGYGTRIHSGNEWKPDIKRGANKRSVWHIATKGYSGAHYAVFPEDLVEPMILAGSSEYGACAECGSPWERVVKKDVALNGNRPQQQRAQEIFEQSHLTEAHIRAVQAVGTQDTGKALITQTGAGKNTADVQVLADEAKQVLGGYFREFLSASNITTGWQPTCTCDTAEVVPCKVLDIFVGSGTTIKVANEHGRIGIGLDLSFDYLRDQARERTGLAALERFYHGAGAVEDEPLDQLPLFNRKEK